jgi:1-acyl-sn-glycerol-3-phosphate acyltransferase
VFRIVDRMNRGSWKAAWMFVGRNVHARFVMALAARQLDVHGLEHVRATRPDRPILLVANHRSFYDLHLASAILFRRLRRPLRIFFPIRGRYYYQSVGGACLNFVAGMWSMYPPLFTIATHRDFNRYSLDLLIELCREGAGHVIGIHPEGGRNRDPDPYTFRKLQPGTGRIIHAARPQVVPVFVAGLENNLRRVVSRNWRGGERIRLHFGPAIDVAAFEALPAKGSTYKLITEQVMERVRELAEQDRARYGKGPEIRDF